MRKILNLYFVMILLIAALVVLMNLPVILFPNFVFSVKLHVVIESFISILMFCVFLMSNNQYTKTNDERFLILAGGFLVGVIFNFVHIFTVPTFPFDNLSVENITKNPSLVYLLVSNLLLPLSVYFSFIYKPSSSSQNNLRAKFYVNYLYLFLGLAIFPLFVYSFLPSLQDTFYILCHSLEYINYALWLMLATILINLRITNNKSFLNLFIIGLLFMGLGGLFYINPFSVQINGLIAHIFQSIGLLFIILGLSNLQDSVSLIKITDENVANLSLMLISFYVCFVAISSGFFNLVFPQSAGYIFVTFLLLFQLVIYLFSAKSWKQVSVVYTTAERSRSLLRVFESIRRTSNKDIVKDTIINEINKEFSADNCFIALFDSHNNSFYLDRYLENLPSKTLVNFESLDEESSDFDKFYEAFDGNIQVSFQNVANFINQNALKGTLQEQWLHKANIKSMYTIPINNYNKLLGYLILYYTSDTRDLNQDDLSYLLKMATEIGNIL